MNPKIHVKNPLIQHVWQPACQECGRQSDQRENYTCHVTLMTYVGAHCNCNYEIKFIASVLWECSSHKSGNLNFQMWIFVSLCPFKWLKLYIENKMGTVHYCHLLYWLDYSCIFMYLNETFSTRSIYVLICFTCEKTCWMCSSYYLLEIYVFIDWVDGMDSKLIYFLSQYSKHSVNFIRHSFKLLSPCPCLRLYQKVFHLMH